MSDIKNGKIVQVIGPVIDVEFPEECLPEIYTALTLDTGAEGHRLRLTAEVQQHLGRNQVRAVAMSTTDGLKRGMALTDTGKPIAVPVGKQVLGRIFNVLGKPIDEAGDALIDMVVRTANGRATAAEALGHKEFVMTKLYRSA